MHTVSVDAFLDDTRRQVDQELDRALPPEELEPAALHRAMRYAVFGGGKRLRPALALAAAHFCGGDPARALAAAAALELLHTYSLVHDDLPCMDDDDYRRGRLTCHKVFGEATAVLAGDALLTLALKWVARGTEPAAAGRDATLVLAEASGSIGMVGGQVMDLAGETLAPDLGLVQRIHHKKTAALLAASLELGAIAAGASADLRSGLREFGLHLGLAFQIVDDCLDVTGSLASLGKASGQDAAAGKQTWPRCVGVEQSLARARAEKGHALRILGSLPGSPDATALLRALADFVVDRQH